MDDDPLGVADGHGVDGGLHGLELVLGADDQRALGVDLGGEQWAIDDVVALLGRLGERSVLGETYSGRHGLSRRLIGLDPTNSNAQERGLVIHAADYVSDELAKSTGKIGRSEGCLAVSPADLKLVLDQLGPRCLIYADRI